MRHPLFAADPQGYQEYTSIVSGWSSATIASSGDAQAKLHYGQKRRGSPLTVYYYSGIFGYDAPTFVTGPETRVIPYREV